MYISKMNNTISVTITLLLNHIFLAHQQKSQVCTLKVKFSFLWYFATVWPYTNKIFYYVVWNVSGLRKKNRTYEILYLAAHCQTCMFRYVPYVDFRLFSQLSSTGPSSSSRGLLRNVGWHETCKHTDSRQVTCRCLSLCLLSTITALRAGL